MNYTQLKKNALESLFSRANDRQKQAIFRVCGPLLIIAGAGSGKTAVLVDRIANLTRFGNAYLDEEEREISAEQREFLESFPDVEKNTENISRLAEIIAVEPAAPWNILAITFTNKAAGELKSRLVSMLGESADKINASTFHSACVRILRREIENLGYRSGFTIYDEDDSKRLLKDILKNLEIDEKMFPIKSFKNKISSFKDRLVTVSEAVQNAYDSAELSERKAAQVYSEYQSALKAANAVDFDDIIMLTVELFEKFPDVLSHYRNLYKYIMVDEYQDTNIAQYRLVSLLASGTRNICVVGDDDQSIYRFRGATVENILGFEREYEDCAVVRLEQNYRSTENILNAANAVIKNNSRRKEKRLWSELGRGEKIKILKYSGEAAEAAGIAGMIEKQVENGAKYSDFAVLYRTNALSRTVETALTRKKIPYKMVGGLRFFDRKEVKDILSYLALLNNPFDEVRFRRVINEPKRGIGDATVEEIIRVAKGVGIDPLEVCASAAQFETLSRKAAALKAAANLFDELDELADTLPLDELIEAVAEKTGYLEMLKALGDEGLPKLENVAELKSNAVELMRENPEATLPDFLEQTALMSGIDALDSESDSVSLMTIHSAKGLEFSTVFILAAEDNVFPSLMSIGEPSELEEERRLAYVAITRAKKQLYATHTEYRMLYGRTSKNRLSTFIREIPAELCEVEEEFSPFRSAGARQEKPLGFLERQAIKNRADAPQPRGSYENFAAGERVLHNIFGEGTVTDAVAMGNDVMLTIEFDTKGVKRIMRNNAKIKKI